MLQPGRLQSKPKRWAQQNHASLGGAARLFGRHTIPSLQAPPLGFDCNGAKDPPPRPSPNPPPPTPPDTHTLYTCRPLVHAATFSRRAEPPCWPPLPAQTATSPSSPAGGPPATAGCESLLRRGCWWRGRATSWTGWLGHMPAWQSMPCCAGGPAVPACGQRTVPRGLASEGGHIGMWPLPCKQASVRIVLLCTGVSAVRPSPAQPTNAYRPNPAASPGRPSQQQQRHAAPWRRLRPWTADVEAAAGRLARKTRMRPPRHPCSLTEHCRLFLGFLAAHVHFRLLALALARCEPCALHAKEVARLTSAQHLFHNSQERPVQLLSQRAHNPGRLQRSRTAGASE